MNSDWSERKMLRLYILMMASLLMVTTAGVDGCSCSKRHPQEHYCAADFGNYLNAAYFSAIKCKIEMVEC